jgi:hypothetical protein
MPAWGSAPPPRSPRPHPAPGQIQRVDAGSFQRNPHRCLPLAQPGQKRLMAACVIGKLSPRQTSISRDQSYRQRSSADIDPAKHSRLRGGNLLVHRPPSGIGWSRLPSLSAANGLTARADLEHAGSKGLRFSTAYKQRGGGRSTGQAQLTLALGADGLTAET